MVIMVNEFCTLTIKLFVFIGFFLGSAQAQTYIPEHRLYGIKDGLSHRQRAFLPHSPAQRRQKQTRFRSIGMD